MDEDEDIQLPRDLHFPWRNLWPVAFIPLFLVPILFRSSEDRLGDSYLKGSISADHPSIGTWTLAPDRCLSGQERGFDGIVFNFPAGSPIRELRLTRAEPGQHWLDLYLVDPKQPPVRIAESECEKIESEYRVFNVRDGGRRMEFLRGTDDVQCKLYGLKAHFAYNGCTIRPW